MSHPLPTVLRNSLHSLGAILGLALLLYPVSSLAATTPTYLVQPKVTGSFGIVSCGSYSIFTGSTPSPTAYCAQFIGNVNTTAVAGSQVAYPSAPSRPTSSVSSRAGHTRSSPAPYRIRTATAVNSSGIPTRARSRAPRRPISHARSWPAVSGS